MSRIILTAYAVILMALGIGLDFLPQEAAAGIGLGGAPVTALLLQVLAAACMGMGFMNWLSKANPMGGIYSRPLALQNFLFSVVAAAALDRAILRGPVPSGIRVAGLVLTVSALAFGWLMFFHDPVGAAKKVQASH